MAPPTTAVRQPRSTRSGGSKGAAKHYVSSSDISEDVDDLDNHANDGSPRKRIKRGGDTAHRLIWSDSDGEDAGAIAAQRFRSKGRDARKRSAAATKKARALDAENQQPLSEPREGHTGVGRAQINKKGGSSLRKYKAVPSDDEANDCTVPEYVRRRRETFNDHREKMKEAGLLLPPGYDDVDFSDNERIKVLKERPNLPNVRTTAPYEDVELPYSLGVIPAPVARYLRDYQVEGTAFLHELFVYQKGGLLGDDMGLGKTVQVIAFLTAAYGKTGDERDRKRMHKMRRAGRWYPKTLIVCPGSLMANWQDELERWGWWHTDLYHGSAQQRNDVLASAKSGMLEVTITTYTTYRIHKSAINTIAWDCVIADECHVIKERSSEITKSMNEINALCRVGLTGTAIQNKYEELWTLLNWCSPGTFGPISSWKVSICEPLKLGQSHNATVYELKRAREVAGKLVGNLLPQFFLRRLKSLIKDQLPRKTDRVVFCPLTNCQAEAYQNFLDTEIVQMIQNSTDLCSCGSGKKQGWCCSIRLANGDSWQQWVFPSIMYLQRMSNHLALLIPQGTDSKDKQDKELELLQQALPDEWERLYATRDSMINYSNSEFCGKWRVLKKLLKFWSDEANNKVLVFSHNVRLLKMLQALFIGTSYNVKYLDGSMTYLDRYAAVQDFNTDPSQFVFLISTRAGGVGLNITSANKVVVVDPNWNPSYDLQAQDRAYRIGQTRDVEVFRLVSQGTIEEVVYARQIYKQQQASIGYAASKERRYFQGVQDRKEQKGEIFGLKNLFALQNEHVVLRDIVNKTNVAESKADVNVVDLAVNESTENRLDAHERQAVDNSQDSAKEDEAISQLAAEITGSEGGRRRGTKATRLDASSDSSGPLKRSDPIAAILASAGVSYTHNNDEVIGSSRVETALSRQAELADSTSAIQQRSRVFLNESQSQEKTNSFTDEGVRIRYKYKPTESVRRRQFCSMASWAGYEDPIDFALVVEGWTQAKRRGVLDKFYAWRRQCLVNGKDLVSETPELDTGNHDDQYRSEVTADLRAASMCDKRGPDGCAKSVLTSDNEDDEL